jgi:hypothetical protein
MRSTTRDACNGSCHQPASKHDVAAIHPREQAAIHDAIDCQRATARSAARGYGQRLAPSPAITGNGRGRITIEMPGEGHSSPSRAPCHVVFPRRDTAPPFVPGRRFIISCSRREKIHRSSVLGTATRCCRCHPCGLIPFGRAAVPRRLSLSGRSSSRAGRRLRLVISPGGRSTPRVATWYFSCREEISIVALSACREKIIGPVIAHLARFTPKGDRAVPFFFLSGRKGQQG